MNEVKKNPLQYYPGIFDRYKSEQNLDHWEDFPEVMWRLGFDMDSGHSYQIYRDHCGPHLKEAHSDRDRKRNDLYVLEHASLRIVGNYLFSYWRYLTHWSMGYSGYDVDFVFRIIAILEGKYTQQ